MELDLSNINDEGRVVVNVENFETSLIADNNDKFQCWINCQPRFLFKANKLGTNDECEILANYIAKEVGVSSVNVFPAVFVDEHGNCIEGILSEDFIENRQKDESIKSSMIIGKGIGNVVYNHVKGLQILALKSIKQNKFLEIDEYIETDLLKMCLFDYLTLQKDRAKRNIEYIVEKDVFGGKIKLAPLFDNSWMFYAHHSSMFNEIYAQLMECKNKEERLEFLKEKTFNFSFEFSVKSSTFIRGSQKTILANELAAEIVKNNELYDVFTKFKDLNLYELQKKIQKEINFKIDDDLIFVAQNLFEFQYNNLEQALNMRKEANLKRQASFDF